MRIGVIGSGKIGATVGKRLVESGHEVAIANLRGRDAVADRASEIGAQPAYRGGSGGVRRTRS